MSFSDYIIGLGALGAILLYVVFIVILFVASWFIGGYISTEYLHFDGLLWWGSTLLIMMVIWGVIGMGNKQLK